MLENVPRVLVSSAIGVGTYYGLCWVNPNEEYKMIYIGVGVAAGLFYFNPGMFGM